MIKVNPLVNGATPTPKIIYPKLIHWDGRNVLNMFYCFEPVIILTARSDRRTVRAGHNSTVQRPEVIVELFFCAISFLPLIVHINVVPVDLTWMGHDI